MRLVADLERDADGSVTVCLVPHRGRRGNRSRLALQIIAGNAGRNRLGQRCTLHFQLSADPCGQTNQNGTSSQSKPELRDVG
ncbi:hypothetical protein B2J96_11115 [Mycobacterium shigaense]|nr:hypothetical protein B2J96_11115 [Mycobacterium shigaense]